VWRTLKVGPQCRRKYLLAEDFLAIFLGASMVVVSMM
jgi:hypothetical protein